ncbi:MAG: hypothetical protein GY938_07080 [Ketobacter sp.]|nr:hypothetical protein [Ketobacter sp.]
MNKGMIRLGLPCLLTALSLPTYANEIDDLKQRISDLEAKVEKSDKKNKRKIDSLKDDFKESKQQLRVSGFGTAGVTKSDSTFSTSDREFTEEFNYSTDTKAAVQLDYRMDENWSATIQLMGRAFNEWDTKTEWAFIKYKYNEQLAFRAGRLRLPFYYYSESLDVGFVYPWARPPMPYYVTSISNYEGFDANYRFATGDVTHEASLLVGATKGTLPNGLSIGLEDMWGGTYQVNYKGFGIRLFGMNADADLDFGGAFGLNEEADRVGYYSIAVSYTGENLFALVEGNRSDTEMVLVRTIEAAHATVGYKWGRWTPYGSYSYNLSLDDGKLLGGALLAPSRLDNSTFGLVFEASTQVNIKFQYDHLYNIGGSNPNFSGLKEGTDVYTINVNAIF